jgi:hypothetical protein
MSSVSGAGSSRVTWGSLIFDVAHVVLVAGLLSALAAFRRTLVLSHARPVD